MRGRTRQAVGAVKAWTRRLNGHAANRAHGQQRVQSVDEGPGDARQAVFVHLAGAVGEAEPVVAVTPQTAADHHGGADSGVADGGGTGPAPAPANDVHTCPDLANSPSEHRLRSPGRAHPYLSSPGVDQVVPVAGEGQGAVG